MITWFGAQTDEQMIADGRVEIQQMSLTKEGASSENASGLQITFGLSDNVRLT